MPRVTPLASLLGLPGLAPIGRPRVARFATPAPRDPSMAYFRTTGHYTADRDRGGDTGS